MKYSPHNYQKYVIEFIKQHPIAAILLDMGMGKTSIVLSALNELMYDSFEVTKILIIAPLRVARNTWSDEIKKWDHLKGLRYSIAVGTAAERKKALAEDADIFIINRENVQWLVEQSGVPFDFDMVVIDELSSFKNWQAKRFKSFMKVRPMVKRVVGLTGTPSSNGLMDLFAEFKVLDMGERLGRFIGQYRVNYFKPDRMNGPIVYTYKLLPGAEDRIYDKISDITISMKGTDYLEMPELISTEYKVYLDEIEKAKHGRPSYIGVKLNSLTDKDIIEKLIDASEAGVKIELIVRGICCLVPAVPELTENITVISVVGRFLEHSRIYRFGVGEEEKVYISSADFMTRNTLRRVEVAVPIYDLAIKKQICHIFDTVLADDAKGKMQTRNREYIDRMLGEKKLDAQEVLYEEAYRAINREEPEKEEETE